jgi:hypothetical protein
MPCFWIDSLPFPRDWLPGLSFLYFHDNSSSAKIFDSILQLGVAKMRPKLQYGEEANSMSFDCMQLQFVFIPQKAPIWKRFKHNLD